jgi:benzoyl-CoA reductase subunit C
MPEPMFPTWKDRPFEEILLQCEDLLEDMDFPTARRWRQGGGQLIGHFQVYFPEEIVHAAGLLPIKMRGAPLEPRKADSRFGSYLCSILKTSLELAMTERVELAMFVSHPICDAARNLAAIWGRNTSYPCQILYLPQNANSSYSAQYLRDEYERLLHDVEKVAGRKVGNDELRNSIAVFNKNRALLRELYAIKRDTPWLLPVEEAYVFVAIGGLLPREEHNRLLETILPMIKMRSRNKQDKIRVVFEGGFCEQPSLDMLRTMSRYCYIVDDDLLIGMRWILEDVSLDGDPLLNLANAYLEKSSYSPVQHDHRKPKEKMLLERIKTAKADAAIITAAKMCEPGLEEQVTYTETLDQEGTPYFVSEFEENMTSFDHIEIQLETFVENILFS